MCSCQSRVLGSLVICADWYSPCRFTWGIEMTCKNPSMHYFTSDTNLYLSIDCTPYLLQLGLTKSKTSLVWIAGPLSGLIIQPLIGVIADRSRSKWGRRRPFMLVGSIVVAMCLFVLGWTSEIVTTFVKDAEKVIQRAVGSRIPPSLPLYLFKWIGLMANGVCCRPKIPQLRLQFSAFTPLILRLTSVGIYRACFDLDADIQ